MTDPELCPTCEGNGWMHGEGHDGEACPDCRNPIMLGGTGYKGGALQPHVQAAKDYVNTQLAVMKRYGSNPNLSPEEYYGLIKDIVDVTIRQIALRSEAGK